MHSLDILGWDESRRSQLDDNETLKPARVIAVDRGAVWVAGLSESSLVSQIAHLRPEMSGLEAPTVGDWVLCEETGGTLRVDRILPRSAYFIRKSAGRTSDGQLILANVERVGIVTAIGRDLNPRRLERYLTAVWAGGAEPLVIVNKIDRPHDPAKVAQKLESCTAGAEVLSLSAATGEGIEVLEERLDPGTSIAFVGSSGVGKSTLVNRLMKEDHLETDGTRKGDDKGRHTTTRRTLFVSPSGIVIIDTPGMRELALYRSQEGLTHAFADLETLAEACRFSDCRHQQEPGCRITDAVERGLVPAARRDSYVGLIQELEATERRAQTRPDKDTKTRWKSINKQMRARKKLFKKMGLKS